MGEIVKPVHRWYGQPITELTREELLDLVEHLVDEMNYVRQDRDKWFRAGDPLKYLMDAAD